MFLLEYKLFQPRNEVLNTPFWEAKKRLRQYEDYKKRQEEAVNSLAKNQKKIGG